MSIQLIMMKSYLIPILLSTLYVECFQQQVIRVPPVISIKNRWVVDDNVAIGYVVGRASAVSSDESPLEFGLEHERDVALLNFGRKSDFNMPQGPLPFKIDPMTGVIRTNQSLNNMGGENIILYVTVNDGYLTQKTQVWATILNTSVPYTQRTIIPPFQQGPPINKAAPPLPPLPPIPSGPFVVNNPIVPNRKETNETNYLFKSIPTTITSPTTTTTNSPTTTTTIKMKKNEEPKTTPSSTEVPKTSTNLSTAAPSPVAPAPTAIDLALTIVPVALVCIMFGLAGIAAFLFRKRLCKKYKASKKQSNEMKKKKSGGREDSIVMQQWSGPRAPANRYEPWNDSAMPPPSQVAPAPPEKPTDRWEYPRHQLKVFNILGEGCFGQVWKCQANNIDGNEGPTIVAVKTLKENAGERERSDLLQELQVMKSLEPHPNVVRLIGCCTDKDPLFVIMEYVNKGKLQSLLRNSRAQRCYDNLHGKSGSLTSRNLTSFCYQVARGMHYLSNKGIIHRDLAARNVLVGEDMTCKVADFGFARDVLASHIYERKSEGRLPIRWMAPESLYDNIFSVKSDVWSLGVLIWEVVTLGSTPYPGLSAGEVMRRVRDGYRLDKPEHCRRELYNIMYYCWDEDPAKRPDFPEVTSLLEQLLLSETDYIELQHFPDHSYYNIVSLSGEKL